MNWIDRIASALGYMKAPPVYNAPEWLRATGEAQRWEADVDKLALADAQSELYLRLSWVHTAVSRVAQAAAVAQFNVMQLEGEETQDIPNHLFERLLVRPNPLMSRFELLEATFSFYQLTGNAYWWLNRTSAKRAPLEIWVIPSHRIRPVPDGRLFIRGYLYDPGNGTEIPLDPWQVVHFKRFHPLNPFLGLSPIEALATVATGDMAMQKWNTNFFDKDNAKPQGALAFADPIVDGKWEQMKKDVREQHGGTRRSLMMLRNAGQGGVSWVNMAMSQKDMEFLQARQFNKEEIFSIFAPGLSSLLAINSTEANSKTGENTFARMAVWPLLVATAEKITNDVLPAYGNDLVGEFEDIRESDKALELQEQEAFSRFHTIDEVRARFYNADPIGDFRGSLLATEVVNGAVKDPADVQEVPPAFMGSSEQDDLAQEPSVETETEEEEDDTETLKAEEIKAFKRWCAKREQPDVAKFETELLTEAEKASLLMQWFPLKAAVQLDPDDDEAERAAREATERAATEEITRMLEGQLETTIPDDMTEATAQQALNRFDETTQTAREALRRALVAGTDLGVRIAVAQLENVGFAFDWTMANRRAREWATQYSYELVSGIQETSRQALQQAISEWVNDKRPLRELIEELTPIFGEQRARLIASTEITRAYAEGQKAGYRATDGIISRIEWRTSRDERVCPICGPLSGVTTTLDGSFTHPVTGRTYAAPPAHPQCRCWIVPVIEEDDGKISD
ncbi:phage portal protein [bacterium]|nr:phage portal protein [bacterium]